MTAGGSHGASGPDQREATRLGADPDGAVDPVPAVAPGPAGSDGIDPTPAAEAARDTPAADAALPPRRLRLFAAVAIAVLVADQATKSWAVSALDDGRIIDVVGSLRFELAFNTGASFSLGSGRGIGPWVTVIAIGMVLALALGSTSRTRGGAVAAGLIGGGAVGNLIDRAFRGDDGFLHGAVVDFINLQWWPVFNIADMGVVVGAILLVIVGLRAP